MPIRQDVMLARRLGSLARDRRSIRGTCIHADKVEDVFAEVDADYCDDVAGCCRLS
jgi:hypothetical protein